MEKIILDTDIGDDIDDALALTFALMSGKVELLGVTTVFRNAQQRAELACCVLEVLGGIRQRWMCRSWRNLYSSARYWRADCLCREKGRILSRVSESTSIHS
ncbi:MAG: nucleoside hydrolase [Candidatus Poribacteria bacterium]